MSKDNIYLIPLILQLLGERRRRQMTEPKRPPAFVMKQTFLDIVQHPPDRDPCGAHSEPCVVRREFGEMK